MITAFVGAVLLVGLVIAVVNRFASEVEGPSTNRRAEALWMALGTTFAIFTVALDIRDDRSLLWTLVVAGCVMGGWYVVLTGHHPASLGWHRLLGCRTSVLALVLSLGWIFGASWLAGS